MSGLNPVLNIALDVINVALFIAVAIAVICKYRQTGQKGFLWLLVPLIFLPLIGLPGAHRAIPLLDKVAAGEVTGVFPYTLVESGRLTLGGLIAVINGVEHVIWSAFVLLCILTFKKPNSQRPG